MKLAEELGKLCSGNLEEKAKSYEEFLKLTFEKCAKDSTCEPVGIVLPPWLI